MLISVREVEYIAKLVKLRFSDDEKDRLSKEPKQMLKHMEKFNEIGTKGTEQLCHPNELVNVMREDKVMPSLALDRSQNYFKVPKVIKR